MGRRQSNDDNEGDKSSRGTEEKHKTKLNRYELPMSNSIKSLFSSMRVWEHTWESRRPDKSMPTLDETPKNIGKQIRRIS